MIIGDGVFTAIIVILCAAFDFWTVKNVSGRLLVGLRWWSEVSEEGLEKWHFESNDQKDNINPYDKRLFWTSQLVATIFWCIISIIKIISISLFWASVGITCFVLSGINYYAHYKCSKEQQKKLDDLLKRGAFAAMTQGFRYY